jgi:hypothetical protein
MRAITKFLGAVAVAAVLTTGGVASAATTFNTIDQTVLDATGTENFGATIDSTGVFNHAFSFTTVGSNDASGSVITIRTIKGLKDLDFTSIDLDGLFAFTPDFGAPGHEPNESWSLFTALIGAGVHTINVHGTVIATSSVDAASYGGTINLSAVAVPEPGTWALMIMGFGGAGAMLRSRRRQATFA